MGDIELAVKVAKELEGILEDKFNAQGKGLHEKASSVQHLLPYSLIQQLRFISTVRNKTVHEADYEMDAQTRKSFIEAYEETKKCLNESSVSDFSTTPTKTNLLSFSVPENLKIFSTGINGSLKVILQTITGELVELQERTINKTVKRKVWMKLQNGKEHYFECNNFNFLARKGHIITIFLDEKNQKLLAVYNHPIDNIFFLEINIKKVCSLNFIDVVIFLIGWFLGTSLVSLLLPSVAVLPYYIATIIYYIQLSQKRNKALKQHILKTLR